MNYRHAFHAGGFADVMKHVLLVRVLSHLRGKDKPFRVIDTHAGVGLYDLGDEEAERTLEWQGGLGRLDEPFSADVEALLRPYRDILASTRQRHGPTAYPGSPQIVRELLRPQDRAVLVELHPADAAALAQRFNAVANMKVLELDGWTALHALIPPRERRGLVLVDPAYEDRGELSRLAPEAARAVAKWPTGTYLVWYPVKDAAECDAALAAFARAVPRRVLRLELLVDRPDDPDRLNGCGVAVVNPPWTLEAEANLVLPALAERLARRDYGAYRSEWMAEPADLPNEGQTHRM